MRNLLLFSGLFFGLLSSTRAQWELDVRLTNDPASSLTSFNNKCVAANGDVVHVVWRDCRDGNFEVYYKRSPDGGKSWGPDSRLTDNAALSDFPSVAVSGSLVNVIWADCRDGNWEIYYKRSTDGGTSWGVDIRLTNNSAPSQFPAAAVSDSVVSVVWQDCRDGNWEIYYKRSPDGGLSWGADVRLINNSAFSGYPSVAMSGAFVHVVWEDNRHGCPEIYYKRSTDGGLGWEVATRLTNDMANSFSPSVSSSGSLAHVVWFDQRDGNSEIYYKRSPDAGVSWGADTRLTNDVSESAFASVAASVSGVHVAWADKRDGNLEIYYKHSADGGLSWEIDTRLTNDAASSLDASVAVSGSAVHVLWQDNRDGNMEIYFKTNPAGNRITGVGAGGLETPVEFALDQNYPNPFNPTTEIGYRIGESGFVSLAVYDVVGREIATLVHQELAPGSYRASFDANGLAGGVYFYGLTTGGQTMVRKMVLVK